MRISLKNFGINVPEATLIKPEDVINERQIIDKVKLPCFVKPTDGGSSFGVTKVKNDNEVLNLIDNFLIEKNSFIFESVEKGKIKGRYTIFGKNPDKIWEFNNDNSYLIKNKKKIKLKDKPDQLIEKIIEEFKFETPKKLPKICSLISGYLLK